ncbi:MAG TPA: FtsK/SpoIIIE domain-containing protein [Pseudogracilibacillus sp.]|nr:FtsK/SpoIIIE domain-containing protein [Pseudogracilibacillus sp.]
MRKKTYRMQRGIVTFSLIGVTLLLWIFFLRVYPLITEKITIIQLPEIESNIFVVFVGLILMSLFLGWSFRNKLWNGLPFALRYYSITKRLRRQIKDARFEDEREFDNRLVRLPKIKIVFNDNRKRTTGKVLIQNSIQFDKKLEDMRIDAALKGYVSEQQYLSQDRNWYVYEIYSIGSQKQIEIKSENELIEWTKETADDYELRLDERTTLPLHHIALVGQTGSGKSFFIQMLVKQVLAKKANHKFFVVDPKKTDVYYMSKRLIGTKRTADKGKAIELIKAFYEQYKKRQNELSSYFESTSNKTYKDAGKPALILLIDEFGSLKESWRTLPKKERDEVESILSELTFEGRQLGCLVWFATQQMDAKVVPTSIRGQLIMKIALGDSDEQTYNTLFSPSVDIPPIQFSPGQGVYSYPGIVSSNKPRLLMVPFCSFMIG